MRGLCRLVALAASAASLLIACEDQTGTTLSLQADPQTGRWYSEQQVLTGRQVFLNNCATCHGEQAQGLAEDWRQRLPDGSFPPPPLDGTAHAWHHPLTVLMQVINEGGEQLGGKMPGFARQLSDADKHAAVAYFQSFWSDEIYKQWGQMGGTE